MSLSTVKITQLTPAVTLNAGDLFVIANKTNTGSPETHSLSAQLIYNFIANQNVLNFLPISGGNLTGPLFAPEAVFTSLTASSATINIINITNYELSGFRILGDLSIYGNVSGYNLRTSFNQGSATGSFSFAIGSGRASGIYSFAEGNNTTASGDYSHAEGASTTSSGDTSHAEGLYTIASGTYSHAEGQHTTASGLASHAEGLYTIAFGTYSHAEGQHTTASGLASHTEGYNTATGKRVNFISYTAATQTFTFNAQTSADTLSITPYTPIRGYADDYGDFFTVQIASRNSTNGNLSALNDFVGYDLGAGYLINTTGTYAHAEGNATTASGIYSHAEGNATTASGFYSHAEGASTTASGVASHAEGLQTTASGENSHAEGASTTASGEASHAEGGGSIASGEQSHAEGGSVVASGDQSHAEGQNTRAEGIVSHAEGAFTKATGNYSHTEGFFTEAKGAYSHAAGYQATAAHNNTYAWSDRGLGTLFQNASTTRTGQYMVSASGGVFIPGNVGIGTDNNSNALTVAGNVSSSRVIYSNELDFGSLERPSLTGIKQALNSFLYVSPALSYVRINGSPSQTLEVGQALTTPAITWNSNKVEPQAVSQYLLTQANGNTSTGNFTFSSFNDPNTYNITTIGGTATQQTSSWSVRVTDWTGAQATGTATASWLYRVYYGVTNQSTPTDAQILAGVVSETNRPLATGRLGLGIKSVIPSNQYFYVAYPQRFGTTSTLKVNGLNFNDFTQQSIATFTNASGGTASYYVYRSNNLLTAIYDIEIV